MMADSELLYCAVIQNGGLLAEHGQLQWGRVNIHDMALAICAQAKAGDTMTVTSGDLSGHYIAWSQPVGVIVIAITSNSSPRRIPLRLITDVNNELKTKVGNKLESTEISKLLASKVEAVRGDQDSLQAARADISDVRHVVIENIDRLLERGERVSLLVDRTDQMSQSAGIFQRQASRVQQRMWLQNVRLWALLATGAALVIYIAIELTLAGKEYFKLPQ